MKGGAKASLAGTDVTLLPLTGEPHTSARDSVLVRLPARGCTGEGGRCLLLSLTAIEHGADDQPLTCSKVTSEPGNEVKPQAAARLLIHGNGIDRCSRELLLKTAALECLGRAIHRKREDGACNPLAVAIDRIGPTAKALAVRGGTQLGGGGFLRRDLPQNEVHRATGSGWKLSGAVANDLNALDEFCGQSKGCRGSPRAPEGFTVDHDPWHQPITRP